MEKNPCSSQKVTKKHCEALGSLFQKHGFSSKSFKKTTTYYFKHEEGECRINKSKEFLWPVLTDASEEKNKEIMKETEELQSASEIPMSFKVRTWGWEGIDCEKEAQNTESVQNPGRLEFLPFHQKLKQAPELLNSKELKSDHYYELVVSWSNERIYNETGKIMHFFTRPNLSLKYNIKYEPQVQHIMNELSLFLDKIHFAKEEIQVENPKEFYKFSVQTLKQELENFGLSKDVKVDFDKSKDFVWNSTKFDINHRQNFSSPSPVHVSKIDQVIAFKQNFENVTHQGYEKGLKLLVCFSLKCKLSKGDAFVPLCLQPVFDSEKVCVQPNPNEVLLVCFWEEWTSSKQMKLVRDLQEKNQEKWGKNMRVVAVNFDSDLDKAKASVANLKLIKMDHYHMGDKENEITKIYGKSSTGQATFVLVDQSGTIVFNQQPETETLEESINELLDGKQKEADKSLVEKEETLVPLSKEEEKKLIGFLMDPNLAEEIREIQSTLNYKPIFAVEWNEIRSFDGELNIIKEKRPNPIFYFSVRKPDVPKFDKIISRLFQIVPEIKFIRKNKIIQIVHFSWGSECHACKKPLKPFDQQYYCHFCNKWFCPDCGDKDDNTKTGNDRLLHPCNMVWINVSNQQGLFDVDDYKMGKNITFKENEQTHNCSCNACSSSLDGNFRFICLNCLPGPPHFDGFVDLCYKCMSVLRKEEEDEETKREKEKIRKKLSKEKHDRGSHLWLRVCFANSGKNY